MSADELLRKRHKPTMLTGQLVDVLRASWAKNVHKSAVRQLESYDDCNFHVVSVIDGCRQHYMQVFSALCWCFWLHVLYLPVCLLIHGA